MPCRSESGSLPKATSNWSLSPTRLGHRVRARTVHADLAVVVDRHEGKVGSTRIHDRDVQAPAGRDRLPVRQRRAAERVDAILRPAARMASISMTSSRSCDIGQNQGLPGASSAPDRRSNAFASLGVPPAQKLIGAVLNQRVTSVSAGPPLGGLYLNPPSSGGLCEGVIDDAVGELSLRPRLYTESPAR